MNAAHRASSAGDGESPMGGRAGPSPPRWSQGRSRSRRRAGASGLDRGSGTIWVVGLMAVIWWAATTLMVAGGVRAARHRAHAAADGAALAAVARAAEGAAVACRIATVVATGTGARLTYCAVGPAHDGQMPGGGAPLGWTADVSVVVTYDGFRRLGSLHITARSRAGQVPGGTRSGG